MGKTDRGDRGPAGEARVGLPARLDSILEELARALDGVRPGEADRLARAIVGADRVYVAGSGRSGLVSSCFAMRLVHLGLVAHVVGEATAPGLGRGDLLIVSTGSGKTMTVLAQARTARTRGARVAAVTGDASSPVARAADLVVEIPCAPYARPGGKARAKTPPASIQPGGTLFEQSLLVFYDGLVLDLAGRLDWSPASLKKRHSNLE